VEGLSTPAPNRPKAIVSWSSGKDCAWCLHLIRQAGHYEIAGLLTTVNEAANRVAMHGVRAELLEAQARAADLPLISIPLPWPCSNDEYERRMSDAVKRLRADGVTHMIFGDLFLEDIRAYREAKLQGTGITPVFPLFASRAETPALAREMQRAELRARVSCVNPKQLDPKFAGRDFDAAFLNDLPASVDPCGENGEFHTFCYAGPMFSAPISIKVGEVVERSGFVYADLLASKTTS